MTDPDSHLPKDLSLQTQLSAVQSLRSAMARRSSDGILSKVLDCSLVLWLQDVLS